MSYNLESIERLCLRHMIPFKRINDCDIEVEFAPQHVLVFANTDNGTDTFMGFRDFPWHTHGMLMLAASSATYFEYTPEELIEALVSGEVLVLSQYHDGRPHDRWLSHRDEKLDLRYIEANEELRASRMPRNAN